MGITDDLIQKENTQLKQQVCELQKKVTSLSKENVVTLIQRQEVIPPGYYANMKRLKQLESENAKLHRTLEFGSISTLESLIETFKAMSKIHLEKISKEYQFYYANCEERNSLKDLISYLAYIQEELKGFLLVDEGGERD